MWTQIFRPIIKIRPALLVVCLVISLGNGASPGRVQAEGQELTITASFTSQSSVQTNEAISFQLSRPLSQAEGRLAVVVGQLDVSSLLRITDQTASYDARVLPLPLGDTEVTLYLVSSNNAWKEVARFPLRVAPPVAAVGLPESAQSDTAAAGRSTESAEAAQNGQPTAAPALRRFGFDKFDWAPSLNIGFKSQFAEAHFPDSNRPQRASFTDGTIQGSLKGDLARGKWQIGQQFDIVGSSFRSEALRFGVLANDAPLIDLSAYSMQFQHGRSKFSAGHTSYGAHRHLINSLNSRGLTATIPLNTRMDFTLAAMNSTNIVGWSNFFGVQNRRHSLLGGTLGLELLPNRPGGLRIEGGFLDAWFQPRNNFNQGNINDTERSRGWTTRALTKDKTERLRLDAGFTRSRFINPEDPLLAQGASVVASRRVTRDARYAEVSLNLLKDLSFAVIKPADSNTQNNAENQPPPADPKKLNLTLNLRHENVDPLYKSIGASTQADLHQNQVEIVGSYGDLSFSAAHTRFNDNLAGIRTILRTNTRRDAFTINTPLEGLFTRFAIAGPNPFFPRIGYSIERVHASADFIPIGGGFDAPGAIPDLATLNQIVTTEWQFKQMRMGYRLNHSMSDNRAIGREIADLQNFTHNATFGWDPRPALNLNFELNFEDANNREQAGTQRTLRFGVNGNWQMSVRHSWNGTFSTIGAGDLARTAKSRNIEFDLQWNYRLTRESENRFKKYQVNYFIRYSNRFARLRNIPEALNNLTKLQTFNTGLNFIFF